MSPSNVSQLLRRVACWYYYESATVTMPVNRVNNALKTLCKSNSHWKWTDLSERTGNERYPFHFTNSFGLVDVALFQNRDHATSFRDNNRADGHDSELKCKHWHGIQKPPDGWGTATIVDGEGRSRGRHK